MLRNLIFCDCPWSICYAKKFILRLPINAGNALLHSSHILTSLKITCGCALGGKVGW